MAFASGLGNRDLKEQPGARSSRIRSAKAEGSWILPSSLYDQLVEGNGNAQPLYNVLEHLTSKDTAFQHHPTVGQMLGWVAAIITDDKAKFDSFGSFAEKLDMAGVMVSLWLCGHTCPLQDQMFALMKPHVPRLTTTCCNPL